MLYKNMQLIQDFVRYQYVILFQKEDLNLNQIFFFKINSFFFSLPIIFVFKKK